LEEKKKRNQKSPELVLNMGKESVDFNNNSSKNEKGSIKSNEKINLVKSKVPGTKTFSFCNKKNNFYSRADKDRESPLS
jgi:hypothetical protein